MRTCPPSFSRRALRPGRELASADVARLWRVHRGVLGVAHGATNGDGRPQFLVRAGDLIGADLLASEGTPWRVFAVTQTELDAVVCSSEAARHEVLTLAYAQSRRQGREILRLRTGLVADRVKQMLMLLGEHDDGSDEAEVELPSLRQLADILDASPEAICRVLGRMRQLDVLISRRPRSARVSTRALTELVLPPGMSSSLPVHRLEPVDAR